MPACGPMWASAPTESYHGVRRGGALPLPRAGKSPKRCRWQKKRGGFEEVPRLAATTVAGNRLARRWATAAPYGGCKGCSGAGNRKGRPYESVTRGAVGRADVGIVPYGIVSWGA